MKSKKRKETSHGPGSYLIIFLSSSFIIFAWYKFTTTNHPPRTITLSEWNRHSRNYPTIAWIATACITIVCRSQPQPQQQQTRSDSREVIIVVVVVVVHGFKGRNDTPDCFDDFLILRTTNTSATAANTTRMAVVVLFVCHFGGVYDHRREFYPHYTECATGYVPGLSGTHGLVVDGPTQSVVFWSRIDHGTQHRRLDVLGYAGGLGSPGTDGTREGMDDRSDQGCWNRSHGMAVMDFLSDHARGFCRVTFRRIDKNTPTTTGIIIVHIQTSIR